MSNTYKSSKKGRQVDSAIDYIEKLPQKLTDIELSIKETNNNKADKVSIPRNLSDLIDNITQQNYDANSSSPQSGKAVAEAIDQLLGSAPEALDTLNELAAALGEDPNFATTVATEIGKKADAKTEKGGFIGGIEAVTTSGGAIGYKAITNSGGAVGNNAKSKQGGAAGINTQTEDGGAVGGGAKSYLGGAVGYYTQTSNGGSIGYNAKSGNGFSGGFGAKVSTDSNGNYIDAIQLGQGTNSNPKSLQVYDYTMMNADGTIPEERLTKAKDYIDEKIGDIDTLLDSILAIEQELIGETLVDTSIAVCDSYINGGVTE